MSDKFSEDIVPDIIDDEIMRKAAEKWCEANKTLDRVKKTKEQMLKFFPEKRDK